MLYSNYKEIIECGARGRNRTGTPLRARDFKSLVSTNFTTRAKAVRILTVVRQLRKNTYKLPKYLEARAGVEPA